MLEKGPLVLLLAIVFLTTLWSGGFGDSARFVLVLAGSIGFIASAIRSPTRLAVAISRAPILGLLGLAILGTVSLLWTSVEPRLAILFALTPAAYAGMAVFTACETDIRDRGALVGAWLAILAVAAAGTGLVGILLEIEPWAIQLGGRLRPAGFVEYPPALALLQLGAMPTLARALLSAKGILRAGVGASLMISAAAVLLAQSKVVLLLAYLLVSVWAVWPERTLAVSRRDSMYPISLWLVGGILLALPIRLLEPWPAMTICAATLLVLPQLVARGLGLIHRRPAISGERTSLAKILAIMLAILFAALAILAVPDRSSQGVQVEQGIDHGRIGLWEVSLDSISEKPLLGHGQGSFLNATAGEQEAPVRFAHNLIVESAVELGAVGALLSTVVLLGALYCAWRRRLDPTAWLYIPMVVGFCVLGLVDWVWFLTGVGAAWALCLGCILIAGSQHAFPPPLMKR